MAADDPDDAYELVDLDEVKADAEELLGNWNEVAVYTLELPVRCPSCKEPIRTLRVVRLTRGQVSFTSTLPRHGRAFVCPQCERLLSVELAGIL
jgi:uncharacterized protein YbaR (Trm112 family)